MRLERQTLIDRIEIGRDGTVSARMRKIFSRGGTIVSAKFHRLSIEPGTDLEGYFAGIAAHLVSMQASAPEEDQWEIVRGWVDAFHTPELVEAHRERLGRASAPTGRRWSEQELGKTFFTLIGVNYLTPACPPGQIDRLVMARTVIALPDEDAPLPQLDVLPGERPAARQTMRRYAEKATPIAGSEPDAELIERLVDQGTVFDHAGGEAPGRSEWDRLTAVVDLAHTTEVVTAFKDKQARDAARREEQEAEAPAAEAASPKKSRK